jgi:hypothetical protein
MRERDGFPSKYFLSTAWIIGLLMFAKFAVQFATAGRYGIFRDELYYLDCARHLAWGYVDQPPLIAFITWFSTHLFGVSLFALRLLPAIAGALLVWVTAQMAHELGGGRFAQCMAAFSIIPVPIYLLLNHWLTMNAFEPLLWMTALWMALRMVARNEPRYWLAIGALCGVGLENKYSMLFLAGALVLGLLMTPERRIFKSVWFPVGVGVALLLFLPNLLWLVHHHFPFLVFERNSRMSGGRILRSPVAFFADQMLIMNPLLAPLWIGGLGWLLLSSHKKFRFLAFTFLAVFFLLLAMQAKNYYVAPVYPVLFAAGSVGLEQLTTTSRQRWLRGAYIALTAAAGLVLAPFCIPMLPVQSFLAYQKAFGGFTPIRLERQRTGPLPQQFADEFGWEDMARETARVYDNLPADDRKRTAIFANDYGEAAAIDFFGPRYGLPNAISNHVTYWLWGPGNYTGETVIVLGSDGSGDRAHFRSVETVGPVDNPYSRADEHFDIYLCRDLSSTLADFWPGIRHW